jgi:hypothetical protein
LILEGHFPTAEVDHFCIEFEMFGVKNRSHKKSHPKVV